MILQQLLTTVLNHFYQLIHLLLPHYLNTISKDPIFYLYDCTLVHAIFNHTINAYILILLPRY